MKPLSRCSTLTPFDMAMTMRPRAGCLASCIGIFLAALAVAWAATGRAMRPVAEAEARERAFVCTASHGLVTPLMAVTANWRRA